MDIVQSHQCRHDNGRKKGRAPSGIQHHRRARSATRYPLVRDSGGGRSSAESNAACCQNGKADHTSHPVEGAAEKVERPEFARRIAATIAKLPGLVRRPQY